MKLKEYIEEYGVAVGKFAKIVGTTPRTVYMIMNQETEPKLSIALRIVQGTKGVVSFEDLISDNLTEQNERLFHCPRMQSNKI